MFWKGHAPGHKKDEAMVGVVCEYFRNSICGRKASQLQNICVCNIKPSSS